jgi:hypothetical protein
MKHLIVFFACLLTIATVKADTVATIGDSSVIIKGSTSCSVKTWKGKQADACSCCITKQKVTTKDNADQIYRTCIKGNYCTVATISAIAPNAKTTEDMILEILWYTIETPEIKLNPDFADKNGRLRTERVPNFIASLRKEIPSFKIPLPLEFSRPKCLQAKALGEGGANTAQLFLVKANNTCITGSKGPEQWTPKYIIKEPKTEAKEIANLLQIHQSDVYKLYNLMNPQRPQNYLAFAFDFLDVKYKFTTGRIFKSTDTHYLIFMPLAPGKSFKNLSEDVAAAIQKGDTTEEKKQTDNFYQSSFKLGAGLGEFHKRYMEVGNGKYLLTNTYVHGDLHVNNVFASIFITIIDFESLASSLKKKRPVAIDWIVLYGFTIAQFKDQYRFPKVIGLVKWNNIFLKPVVLGYISNWPANQQKQVLNEIRTILTSITEARKYFTERSFFINLLTYRAAIKDINRVFDEIAKTLP